MSTIIGCGTAATGGANLCKDCPFQYDPISCLEWRRVNGAEVSEVE